MRHAFSRALAGPFAALCVGASAIVSPASAQQLHRSVGEDMVTGASYCPVGTYLAAGQLLRIKGNEALFQALGTRFGGDGVTTFGLPDRTGQYLTYCIIDHGPAMLVERYVGEIMTAGGQCPDGTSEADGRILAVLSNTALYSLFGTRYGGDGAKTFALPDLRGNGQTYCVISLGTFPRYP